MKSPKERLWLLLRSFKNRKVASAFKTLAHALQTDGASYVRWHANIAMTLADHGGLHQPQCNVIADALMTHLFGTQRGRGSKVETAELSDGYHTFKELYDHRHALFVSLMQASKTGAKWRSRLHADGTSLKGWFIAGIKLESKQISYHLPDVYWQYLESNHIRTLSRAPEWDWHTSREVPGRLLNFYVSGFC
jgi:hypothetical protein